MYIKITFLLFCSLVFSQSRFKPAIYIKTDNQKVSGFINNEKIFDNDFIEYRDELTSKSTNISINSIKEIILEDKEKYIVEDVEIDQNRTKDLNSSTASLPVKLFKKRMLLRKLVEGEYNLFISSPSNVNYFFFNSKDNPNITYLIYNESSEQAVIERNLFYVRQLKILFKDLTINEKTDYKRSDLINLFTKKNGVNNIDLTKNEYKGKFTYKVLIGVKSFNVKFVSKDYYAKDLSANKIVPSFGGEISYSFFEKFNFFARGTYEKLSDVNINKATPALLTIFYENIIYDANYLNFDVGARHYFGKNSNKLFWDLSLQITNNINSKLKTFSVTTNNVDVSYYNSLDANFGIAINLGFGYDIGKNFGAEVRYISSKNFYNRNSFIESRISNVNFNLYYKFN